MLAVEGFDVVPCRTVARKQMAHIGEDRLFLIHHMLMHFGRIVVEEPDDGVRDLVTAAGDGCGQLAPYIRQAVLQKVVV